VDRLADAEGEPGAVRDVEGALRQEHPEAVLISAGKGWNLESLLKAIEAQLATIDARRPVTA
jgi:50S ribosomal subunit-associated GTPase HflX